MTILRSTCTSSEHLAIEKSNIWIWATNPAVHFGVLHYQPRVFVVPALNQ